MHAIYKIQNEVNGKLYVGSAQCVSRRFIEHKRDLKRGTHGNAKLQRAWNKYGSASFTFSILEEVADKTNLIAREQFWIDATNVVKGGYNICPTAGSNLGMKLSDESRKRISDALKGKKNSPEHIERTRVALTGRTMTDEQKLKMRMAKLGKRRAPHSAETKAKISASHTGKTVSDETRAKQAAAKLGKKQTAEAKLKRGAAISAAYWARKEACSANVINQPA